jgi:hypothetical protein
MSAVPCRALQARSPAERADARAAERAGEGADERADECADEGGLVTALGGGTRRVCLRGAGALALSAVCGAGAWASTEQFPSRPVTLWVPWPAGGATDVSLRLLAELASVALASRC